MDEQKQGYTEKRATRGRIENRPEDLWWPTQSQKKRTSIIIKLEHRWNIVMHFVIPVACVWIKFVRFFSNKKIFRHSTNKQYLKSEGCDVRMYVLSRIVYWLSVKDMRYWTWFPYIIQPINNTLWLYCTVLWWITDYRIYQNVTHQNIYSAPPSSLLPDVYLTYFHIISSNLSEMKFLSNFRCEVDFFIFFFR